MFAYASRRYADAESRYCITRRELLAVVYGLRQFPVYLLGRHLRLRTDHAPLTWLQKTPEPIGQQGRWLDLLTEFPFDVEHRPGLKHNNADALSRIPCRQCGRTGETDSESLTTEMCRLVATDTDMVVTAHEEMLEPAALRRENQRDWCSRLRSSWPPIARPDTNRQAIRLITLPMDRT